MRPHTHIEQVAYPEGACPACDVVWGTLRARVPVGVFDIDRELREGESLLNDYGRREQLFWLTQVRDKAQMVAWQLEELG